MRVEVAKRWFKVNTYSSRLITSVFVFFTLPLIGLGQHQGHQMPQIRSPTPATSPSPSVEEHDMDSMLMGPLVVMTRDSMGIRVGSSETHGTNSNINQSPTTPNRITFL